MKKIFTLYYLCIFVASCSQAGIKYSRSEYIDYTEIKTRKSMTARSYVFPRVLFKYGQYHNYLNWWVDRPLIMQRSLRYPTGTYKHVTRDDFLGNTVPILKKYDVDGFSSISTPPGHCRMFEQVTKWQKKAEIKGLLNFAAFQGGSGLDARTYKYYDKVIKLSLSSPYSFRINGKAVVSSYVVTRWGTSAKLKTLLDKLRKENGDNFYFVADIGAIINRFIRNIMVHNNLKAGQAPKKELEKIKAKIRPWLDVSDGLTFAGAGHMKSYGSFYAFKFNESYYRKLIIPILLDILAEPKYRGKKIFGLSAVLGYTNFLSGINFSEENTRRLRKSFESAMSVKPDYINMPEWNEVNENTCIQPTVSNGWTTQRIIKYFMSVIKNTPPTPNKGDDLSIPNMALSYRKTLKYGEVLEIEMLNIPDSNSSETYTAQLILKNIVGQIIHKFPIEKLMIKKMKDITYNIPSGQFMKECVLYPELIVVNPQGEKRIFSNFHYVRLHPTVSWDYQSVKQCLRDQLKAVKTDFRVVPNGGGINISGLFKCDEKLASVEVLENEREVFAVDRLKEFDRSKDFIVYFGGSAEKTFTLAGSIKVEGASKIYARPTETANSDFIGLKVKGNTLNLKQHFNRLYRSFFLSVPRKNIDKIVLKCNLNGKKFSLPLSRLMKKREFGVALNEKRAYIQFRRFDMQPDIPVRINAKSTEFNFSTQPRYKYPVYSLRAITVSGKIYRSKAIMPFKPTPTPKVALTVWDELTDKPATIKVAKSRIPNITFSYDPDNGDALECKWSSFWTGEMGGGFKYGDPFNRRSHYPKNAKILAPQKVKDSKGNYCLNFDGKGTYVTIPREALPRGPFSMSFDILPTSGKAQVIFKHHGIYIGSLVVMLVDRKLTAAFTDRSLKTSKFDTELVVPLNKWSKVKISYDYRNITFSVNNKSKSYPFNKRALQLMPCVFGGHTRSDFGVKKGMSFFKGKLRDLQIIHNAE